MEETISLQEIFQVIKKRMKLIIAITVAAVLVSALITLFILTPKYEASSQFIVSQSEPAQELNINDIRTNVEMINTYNVIITSPAIMDQVIEELDLNLSNGALASKISVANAQDSQVVNVTVTDTDPAVAANIANTTVEVFKESVPTYMNVDNVSILSAAVVGDNPAPVSPNVTLNIAIAFVLGVMVGVGLAFLLEYLDTTIKTEEDIEKLLGTTSDGRCSDQWMRIQLLTHLEQREEEVRNMARRKTITKTQVSRTLVMRDQPKSPISEQFRTLRTNLQFSAIDNELKSLLVTSSSPSEGKSTTASNLAIAFAQQGKKVLLVEPIAEADYSLYISGCEQLRIKQPFNWR